MTIKNYGQALPGAAKDRTPSADRIIVNPHGMTLAEIFPMPDWQGLIDNGARVINVSAARALRETLRAAPSNEDKRHAWAQNVIGIAETAEDLINPQKATRTWQAVSRAQAFETIVIKARIYEAFGHERSLADLRVSRHDKDTLILARGREPIAIEETADEIVAAACRHAGRILGQKMTWFTRPLTKDKQGPTTLCAKLGTGRLVDVENAPTLEEAKRRLNQERKRLNAAFEVARKQRTPKSKTEPQAVRIGPHRRLRNVSSEEFAKTFGLSTVEFGASLTDAHRQRELNATIDALTDLVEIMNEPASAIGLRKTLGMSFGARGKGGKNAAMAHYSVNLRVINMTKKSGAGSLAHEWFHAFDNAASPRRYGFVSEEPRGTPLQMVMRLCSETGMEFRSQRADIRSGRKYYATPCEMAARAFEAWVQYRLTALGRRNDHLVTIPDAPAPRSKDRDLHPYPLPEEMPMLDSAFSQMFNVSPVQTVAVAADVAHQQNPVNLSQPEFDF